MNKVTLGIERLIDDPAAIRGKRVAVLSHQAAVTHDLRRTVDVLSEMANVVRIFGPEHGFWGVKQDMELASGEQDLASGVEIVSLYGATKCELWPKVEQFADIDVLVVDLQDVGARYYTFANTMAYCMEVAQKTGIKVIVCDRPNPINGVSIEGNLFDDLQWVSFVGQFNIAPRHGMTIGELALYYRDDNPKYECDLEVIKMEGWRREMWWDDTDLPWVPPSPNMPSLTTATVYPGMCLIEATEASEGRGTTIPFELYGAPGVDPFVLAEKLNAVGLPGIRFRAQFFQPTFQKHAKQVCGGVQLHVTDRNALDAYRTGLWCTKVIHDLWPEFEWRQASYEYERPGIALEQLLGTRKFRLVVESGDDLDQWMESWNRSEFEKRRKSVLLY